MEISAYSIAKKNTKLEAVKGLPVTRKGQYEHGEQSLLANYMLMGAMSRSMLSRFQLEL